MFPNTALLYAFHTWCTLHQGLWNNTYLRLTSIRKSTNSMEQGPSYADSCSYGQDISCLLQNPEVHYYIQRSWSLHTIMSQLSPINTLTSHIFKIHLNLILKSISSSPKWTLVFTGLQLMKSLSLHFTWEYFMRQRWKNMTTANTFDICN
jgi:hypothetical protein